MRGLAVVTAAVISLIVTAMHVNSRQNSAPAWLNLVVSAPVAPNQNVESVIGTGAESFINNVCQPSGLDGLQILSVQTGHNEVFHLHLYCRQDNAASAHYKVTMVSVPDHKVDETVNTIIGKPNVRVGPLYLGATDQSDAIVLIEKTQ